MPSIKSLRDSTSMRLFIILLITPYSGICIDLYVPSLPAISHFFHTTPHMAQMTVPAFLIGYGIAQFIIGPISDSIGRRKLLVVGLVFCTIFSILAAMSTSITMLLIMRFLQGVAISAPGGLVRPLMADSYSGKKLKHVVNYATTTWGLGPIVAPGIGGYLQVLIGWQASFLVLAGYGLLLLIVCSLFLPETNQHPHPLAVRAKLRDIKQMIADNVFRVFVYIMILAYGFLLIFNVLAPFLVEHHMGYSPVVYGHMAMILGLGWLAGSLTNRLLLSHYEPETCLSIGAVTVLVVMAGYWVVAVLLPLSLWTLVLPALCLFAGSSICFTNTFGFILERFPKKTGTASSLYGASMIVGIAVMTFFAGYAHLNSQFPMLWIYTAFTIAIACCIAYALTKERAAVSKT
jgi:MFS transporter, DHA1 family, multidrug resistance protein